MVMKAKKNKLETRFEESFNGLRISGKLTLPKRRGKTRILIKIDADKSALLRVEQSLCYTNSVAIRFASIQDRNSKDEIV
jgi:hypothetical protein